MSEQEQRPLRYEVFGEGDGRWVVVDHDNALQLVCECDEEADATKIADALNAVVRSQTPEMAILAGEIASLRDRERELLTQASDSNSRIEQLEARAEAAERERDALKAEVVELQRQARQQWESGYGEGLKRQEPYWCSGHPNEDVMESYFRENPSLTHCPHPVPQVGGHWQLPPREEEIATLKAEAERLRAALVECAARGQTRARSIARAALESAK